MEIPEILLRTDKDLAFKKVPVDPVHIFRGVSPKKVKMPELAINRKCTDIIFLLIFGIAVICFVISSAYIAAISDIRITLNGRDKCENVCGIKNTVNFSEGCPAKDYTNYPIVLLAEKKCITQEQCIDKEMVIYMGRCMSSSFTENYNMYIDLEFWESIEKWNPYTIIICPILPFIASVLAILVFYILRDKGESAVDLFAVLSLLMLAIVGSYFWYLFSDLLELRGIRNISVLLMLCNCLIITTIFVASCISYFCFRNRVTFLIQLYRETLTVILGSRILLFIPIVAVIIHVVLTFCMIYMIVATISVPVPKDSTIPVYRILYLIFLAFMMYWIINFSNGCQCMAVAGIFASYYFSRKKTTLICRYFEVLGIVFRFHMGTIASGSLVITIITILKIITEKLLTNLANRKEDSTNFIVTCIANGSLTCLEDILNVFSTKAYIITAIHGKSFRPSGKRAMQLIWTNYLDVISIDGLNYIIQLSAAIIILLISLIIAFAIVSQEHKRFIYVNLQLGFCLVVITLYFFFSTLNISLATIFLCFCEDKNMNDGSRKRRYYMTNELRDAIAEAFKMEAEAEELTRKTILEEEAEEETQNLRLKKKSKEDDDDDDDEEEEKTNKAVPKEKEKEENNKPIIKEKSEEDIDKPTSGEKSEEETNKSPVKEKSEDETKKPTLKKKSEDETKKPTLKKKSEDETRSIYRRERERRKRVRR